MTFDTVFPYDPNTLKDELTKQSCVALRAFIQALSGSEKSLRKLKKSDLVATILVLLKRRNVKRLLLGHQIACNQLDRVALERLKFPVGFWKLVSGEGNKVEKRLICSMYNAVLANQKIKNDAFGRKTCTSKAHYEPFGSADTRAGGFCPRGKYLDENGCCKNVIDVTPSWTDEILDRFRTDDESILRENEDVKAAMDSLKATEEMRKEFSQDTFESDADFRFTHGLVATFKQQMVLKLTDTFEIYLADMVMDDDCEQEEKPFKTYWQTAKTAVNSLKSSIGFVTTSTVEAIRTILSVLWKIMKRFLGYTVAAVKTVTLATISAGYKVVLRLKSIASKIAWFIVGNPAQARHFFLLAKLVKKWMCRKIGESLVNTPVMAALEYQFKKFDTLDLQKYTNSMVAAAKRGDSVFRFCMSEMTNLAGIVAKVWTPSLLTDYFDTIVSAATPAIEGSFGFAKSLNSNQSVNPNYQPKEARAESFYKLQSSASMQTIDPRWRQEQMKKMKEEPASLVTTAWTYFASLGSVFESKAAQTVQELKNNIPDAIDDAKDIIVDSSVQNDIAAKMAKSKTLRKSMKKMQSFVAGAASSIPFVGNLASAAVNLFGDLLAEGLEEAIEDTLKIWMYYSNFTKSFELVMEFLSLEHCIRQMKGFKKHYPTIAKYLSVQQLTYEYFEKVALSVIEPQEFLNELEKGIEKETGLNRFANLTAFTDVQKELSEYLTNTTKKQ